MKLFWCTFFEQKYVNNGNFDYNLRWKFGTPASFMSQMLNVNLSFTTRRKQLCSEKDFIECHQTI